MTAQFADALLAHLLLGCSIALGGVILAHVLVEVAQRVEHRRYVLRVARAKHRLGIALNEEEYEALEGEGDG